MVGRSKTHTKADDHRFMVLIDTGCIPCAIEGLAEVPTQIHHILTEGGVRYDDEHQYTYGACPWHHQGEVPEIFSGSHRKASRALGPSMAIERRSYVERYGTDIQLKQIADAMVRLSDKAQREGRYLTGPEKVGLIRELHKELVINVRQKEESEKNRTGRSPTVRHVRPGLDGRHFR